METLDALSQTFNRATTVIAGVTPDQMTGSTPCTEWDVQALLAHTVGVVTNIGCGVRGEELIPDVNGIALDADVAAQFRTAATGTLDAWRATGFETEVNIGAGPMPAVVGANINLVDTAVHTWDIARATGQSEDMPDDLAAAVLAAAQSFLNDDLRKYAGIDPAVPVGADATPTETLIAFLGRKA